MFATTRKYLLLPAMIGLTTIASTVGPAIAAPLESIEPADTASVNCVQPELKATGFCVPLPSIPVNPAMMSVESISAEPKIVEPEIIDLDTTEPEIIEPMAPVSIEALNTPEALSQIPRLPAVVDRFASASTQDFEP